MRRILISTSALLLIATACGGGGSSGGGSDGATQLAVPGAAPQSANPASPGAVQGPVVPGPGGLDGETSFAQTVYPIVVAYCVNCHAGGGPGFPHIAHPDVGTAYRAVVDNQKVNFTVAQNSRLVQRLVTDQHFCWSDCAADGAEMQAAIEQWAALIAGPGGPGATVNTGGDGQILADGTISSATQILAAAAKADSGRDNGSPIAFWNFKKGEGDTAFDTSPVGPSMDLTLEGATWLSGGGLEFANGARAISNETDSRKLWNEIASGSGSQEYAIEAWVTPANTSQEGPARIVSYSLNGNQRNFTMAQLLYNYVFRNRSMALGISPNGTPALQTADADEDLQAVLQHVVMNYDQVNGRRIYVNGQFTDDVDPTGPGNLINWNPDYVFVLGNEVFGDRPWSGQIRLLAIYDEAMGPATIMQNFQAGALDRFRLSFGLGGLIAAGSFIEFEITELDDYSYLFCFPLLVTSDPSGFPVQGLRVSVNGVAPVASQSFPNVSAVIDQPAEPLSPLCSVVPKDLGADLDAFAIWFDVLGPHLNVRVELPPVVPPDNSVAAPLPDVGIRSFEQVNDTMSELTGVPATTQNVEDAFNSLKEQLPATTDVRTFVSAHQVAVSNLALEYCDALVESQALRQAFFGTQFQFDANVVTAFAGQVERDLIITALIDRMIQLNLQNQPDPTEVEPLLNTLIDDLTVGCDATNCDATRTRTVVKATCAAVLSSAPVQLQ